MLKLLEFLFTGCWHNYEFVAVNKLHGPGGAVGQRVISKCHKCGKYRKQDLI